MITQYTILDMIPGIGKPTVNVSQYDTGARTLVFQLRERGKIFTPPAGTVAKIHGIKPDSTYFAYAAEVDGDAVIADCKEQMTPLAGLVTCEIVLTDSDGKVGSCNFILNVEKSPETGAIISDTDIPVFEQLATRAEQAASSATASATAAEESAEQAGESATNAGESADRAAREAETASQAAEEAGESAVAAAESASSASGSEASARGFAEQAEQSAGEASESAQGATQASQTASAKASEAAASADRASGSAVDSANAANLASGYADTAQAQAQAAGVSATNAAGSASTASQAAGTAITKAGEASQSATAASTSASQAAESATAANTSAEQAADSALAALNKATEAANSADSAAASASAAAQSAADIAASAAQIQINTDNIAALQIVESTEAADITSIEDGADGVPMQSLKVYIEPVQDLHGYDNPWPAGGGKNLFDKDAAEIGKWLNVSTGAIENTSTNYALSDYIPVKSGLPYVSTNTRSSRRWFYDAEKNPVEIISTNPYTPPSDGFVLFTISLTSVDINTVQFEQGTTLSAYSPYSNICPISGWNSVETVRTDANGGNRLTIATDLPSTVYGGVLDVISGELTVDRAMVDLGSFDWVSESEYAPGQFRANPPQIAALGASYSPVICSILKGSRPKGYLQFEYGEIGLSNSPDVQLLRAKTTLFDGATSADVKTFFTGQTLVYSLATPITYNLTPEEVKTLLKVNNIFADAGQTAIVYVADPKTYIDNSIADAVASLT